MLGSSSCQSVPEAEHDHLGPELLGEELRGVSSLHYEQSVSMRVRVVLSETYTHTAEAHTHGDPDIHHMSCENDQ